MGGWARWTTVIEPDGDGSRLRVTLEYELPGEIVGSLFGMLTGNRIEREFRRTYERLKGLAETAATAESPPGTHVTERAARDRLAEPAAR
jgi:uncharacterized membrane protein